MSFLLPVVTLMMCSQEFVDVDVGETQRPGRTSKECGSVTQLGSTRLCLGQVWWLSVQLPSVSEDGDEVGGGPPICVSSVSIEEFCVWTGVTEGD